MFIPYFCQKFSLLQIDSETLINNALKCLEKRLCYDTTAFTTYENAKAYLRLQIGNECNETFAVLFLDNRNRLLAFEKLFIGTINATVVHPRVIMQRALAHNAATVILSHNHPSGCIEPSLEDKMITQKIIYILGIIDINVLDHIIVSSQDSFSFVEHKLL